MGRVLLSFRDMTTYGTNNGRTDAGKRRISDL